MKKKPDLTDVTLAAGVIADIETERDIEEAEMEERILALEEEIARLKGGSSAQRTARSKSINQRKQAAEEKRKAAEARHTAIFIIMLLQALFYLGMMIYFMTHY